jgi:hypothetical protein
MSKLRFTVDDEIHRRAQLRAAEEGTTLDRVVQAFLTSYAGLLELRDQVSDQERRARRRFVELAKASGTGAGDQPRSWRREDLYDERVRWPRS